jgi:hypothetical protein
MIDPSLLLPSVAHMTCVGCFFPESLSPKTIDDAVFATLPTAFGQRNRRLFHLARYLKTIIPKASPDELRQIVQNWHKLALPNVRTKPFDETWNDFRRAWQQVKRPAGQPRWSEAVSLADRLELPAAEMLYDTDAYRRLMKLCVALHQVHGGRQFPLACRMAGRYLGVVHKTAADMLKTLVFDGVLVVANKVALSGRTAYEYRYAENDRVPLATAPARSRRDGVPFRRLVREVLTKRGIDPGAGQ